jgi:hypothetical protein
MGLLGKALLNVINKDEHGSKQYIVKEVNDVNARARVHRKS